MRVSGQSMFIVFTMVESRNQKLQKPRGRMADWQLDVRSDTNREHYLVDDKNFTDST